jgi:hypothetical protein
VIPQAAVRKTRPTTARKTANGKCNPATQFDRAWREVDFASIARFSTS